MQNSDSTPIKICLQGATGSVGQSAIEVILANSERCEVVSFSAGKNWSRALQIIRLVQPQKVAMQDAEAAARLCYALAREDSKNQPTVVVGTEHIINLPQKGDTVIAAITGAAGLPPAFRAVELGCRLLLANKESLVIAGDLLLKAARLSGAEIIPVDSEHQGVCQCLGEAYQAGSSPDIVKRITLTASGGPFRGKITSELEQISPQEALQHPIWDMGAKISVDSATMMNKALEMIEAAVLFDLEEEQIDVLVHPQSLFHAFVETVDGAHLAYLSKPDMRVCLASSLGWGRYPLQSTVSPLSLMQLNDATFEEPDTETFPALVLARKALQMGPKFRCVFNAANEVAVENFLAGKLPFLSIAKLVDNVLSSFSGSPKISGALLDLDDVLATDLAARDKASELMNQSSLRLEF